MAGELILVAVPGGLPDPGGPVVRVVVVPKLAAAATLAASPLADWPARLAAATFRLEVDGVLTDPVLAPVHEADPDLWRRMLGTLRVLAAEPPAAVEQPEVLETAVDADDVEETYRATATVDVPASDADHSLLGQAAAAQLRQRWRSDRRAGPDPGRARGTTAEPTAPPADFHHVVARLREHPAVLRRLGLVFDLPVPPEITLSGEGTVRVRWTDPPADLPTITAPASRYAVHPDRGFLPGASATASAGLVDLGDETAWTTSTVDVDHTAARLRDAAAPLPSQPDALTDVQVRLPATRSTGISLLRRQRASDFKDQQQRAMANLGRGSVEDTDPLDADDLALGLRIDVRPKGVQRWTSVMRRQARYTLAGADLAEPAEEEGHLRTRAAVRRADGGLLADALVARWHGWSLGVPQVALAERARGNAGRAGLTVDFGWEFEVPTGSLVPLRFGRDYELRARVADLAGGGLHPEVRGSSSGTGTISYLRHEPVAAPTVALHDGTTDLGPGGALDVLVIRDDGAGYPANDVRVVRAPQASLEVVEQHGLLDNADEATFELVRRALDSGLPDPASGGAMLFPVPEPGAVEDARATPVSWGGWPAVTDLRLRLVARRPGQRGVIDTGDETDTTEVRLGPAEQLRLAVSSFLRDDFPDHFAVHHWRAGGDTGVVKDGRHPMTSPAHELLLVHAVRRPLSDPAGSLEGPRAPGDRHVEFAPAPAHLGIDVPSTARLQVSAVWDEVTDDVRRPTRTAVVDLAVERGDTAFREPLVHHFGDTRHRRVTYHFAAVSRFRHFYRDDEDDEQFVARGETGPLSLPSTAAPVPVAVHAVVPAFPWIRTREGTTVRHVRGGGVLRVELARPWFLTGEGEQLGVVLEQCVVARDPVWDSGPVPRAVTVADLGGTPAVARLLPDGSTATVAGYDVALAGDRWAADVALPSAAAATYRPFVRLAVCRYQPQSLPDLEVSRVTETPLVQLLPERTLVADLADPATVTVTLDGPGPTGPLPNRVDVVLETRTTGASDLSVLGPTSDVGGWTPAGTVSTVLGVPASLVRPAGPAGGVRLRVREVEQLGPAPEAPAAGTPDELHDRIVFTDVIEI